MKLLLRQVSSKKQPLRQASLTRRLLRLVSPAKQLPINIFVMTLVLALGFSTAYAIHSEPSSLTVIMKNGEESLHGISVAICRVADATVENNAVFYHATAEFSGVEADFSMMTKENNIALAASLNSYAYANNIVRTLKTTNSSGVSTFTDLPAGLYMVAQMDAQNSGYIIEPYLVAVPAFQEAQNKWNYHVSAYPKTEPVKRDDESTSISVYKVWAGTTDTPASIMVQLYRNGVPYGNSRYLNPANFWSYTWTNLSVDASWTVDEYNVPTGYVKTISGNASVGFVITNTRKTSLPDSPGPDKPSPSKPDIIDPLPTEPGSPDSPEQPDKPVHPSLPGTNDKPVTDETNIIDNPLPGDPGEVYTPDIIEDPLPGEPEKAHSPRTSDDSNMQLWISLIAAGTVGLFAIVFVILALLRRKKCHEK